MTRNAHRGSLKIFFTRGVPSVRRCYPVQRFKFRSVVSDGKKAGRAPRPVRGRAWNKDLRKSRGEHGNEGEREPRDWPAVREKDGEREGEGGGGGLAVLHIPVGPPRLWSSPRHAELTSTSLGRWLAGPVIDVRRRLANCVDAACATHARRFHAEQPCWHSSFDRAFNDVLFRFRESCKLSIKDALSDQTLSRMFIYQRNLTETVNRMLRDCTMILYILLEEKFYQKLSGVLTRTRW